MKNWSFKSLIFLVGLGFFITSCTDDGTGVTPTVKGPAVTLEAGSGVITTDTSVTVGGQFTVIVKGSKTDFDMATLTVEEAGVKIALDRIDAASNPISLLGTDKTSFTRTIKITAHTNIGEKSYSFVVADANGNRSSKVVKITTVVVTTPVKTLSGILLNQAGPAGTGGLDLDNGAGTSSTAVEAEIRDMGIDLGNPVATNWKQQIAAVNGAEVKYIKKGSNGVPETFSFATVATQEDILALFDKGTAFTKVDGTIKVSDLVAKDDVFIVKKGTKYYLLLTKEIKVTNADNADSYTFDVKL